MNDIWHSGFGQSLKTLTDPRGVCDAVYASGGEMRFYVGFVCGVRPFLGQRVSGTE